MILSRAIEISLCLVPILVAQEHQEHVRDSSLTRPAWVWPLEERLARRLDPAHVRDRARAYRERLHAAPATPGVVSTTTGIGPGFVIEGSRNPELFVPTELFESVLRGFSADKATADRVRESYRQRIEAFGWDADGFWSRLEPLVADYLDTVAATASIERDLQGADSAERRRRLTADLAAAAQKACHRRAIALRAASAEYGRDEFTRFLYVVVAPSLNVVAPAAGENEADELRRAEDGCR